MSLFKSRTFWKTQCDEEENFDQNSVIAAKLNSEFDSVVTGSHSGVLRIFQPELNELHEYKPRNLLIEKLFNGPVLQVGRGRLVSGSPRTQLAVLQPRSLTVYSLIIKEGATEHGIQNILQLNYEHKLRRLAANFVLGQFGGNQNRDFICVQSLDGMLSFYEQESFSFSCFLPQFLLPGPIAFVKKSDSFVLCSSDWCITSFKYKLLSEAGQNSDEDDDMGKKVISDWRFNLGECIIDLQVVDDTNLMENSIMVLGERNFFCLNDSGKLKYMKKLDFAPICFANYILDDKTISMIVSETRNLLIYQNTSLKWTAQLEIFPIAIKKANLENIPGSIVLLSEEGQLECCYLGTEPNLFVAPPITAQNIDFEKAGLELATLHKIIKSTYKNDIKVTNLSAERELGVSISVSPHLEFCAFESNLKNAAITNKSCSVSIDIHPQALFEQVQVAIKVQHPLKVEPAVKFFSNLTDNTSVKCCVFVNNHGQIPSLQIEVAVSFISNLGVPRCVTKSAMLPMNLVVETCPPVKDSECKLTLSINQSPVALSVLFPEFSGQSNFTASSGAVGFRNVHDGVNDDRKVVSVLLAKSTERYRIQADSLDALAMLIEQIIYRLRKYYTNIDNFAITFNSALPVNECLQFIRNHFEARRKYNLLQNELSQLSAQFRLIQKRLIAKFKVKNPTPLTNLELLLEDTFQELIKTAEKLNEETNHLLKSQNELSCSLHAITNLIKLMDCNNNTFSLIGPSLSSNIYDLDGQSWEDVIDAGLCYLLRTVLAKSDKDKLRAAHTSFDEVKDVAKLEKHFTQVLERIPKMLETDFPLNEDVSEVNTSTSATIIEEEEAAAAATVPIGSKIGESSSRLLSARKVILPNK